MYPSDACIPRNFDMSHSPPPPPRLHTARPFGHHRHPYTYARSHSPVIRLIRLPLCSSFLAPAPLRSRTCTLAVYSASLCLCCIVTHRPVPSSLIMFTPCLTKTHIDSPRGVWTPGTSHSLAPLHEQAECVLPVIDIGIGASAEGISLHSMSLECDNECWMNVRR